MVPRAQRVAFRVAEVLDYRTFVVAGAFATLLLVGYLMVGAIQGAHDATQAANQRGKAATKRIDGLQAVIAEQAQHIADNSAQQAAMRQKIDSLSRQVKEMGGDPVVGPQPSPVRTYVVIAPSPQPSSRATLSPRPFASPSQPPRPSSSPSPTCRPLPIIGCRGARR